jgi:flagellar hook-associated protein 2
VADAIGGVTLNFLSTGTSTVTVSVDDDAIVEDVQAFITEFNASITQIRDLTGAEGTLRSDGTLTGIENFLRSTIFTQIAGVAGDYQSLLDIGISTGDSFDATAVSQLELDEDAFLEALRKDRSNIENLFSNTDGTGIADKLFAYLDEATKTTGFLNQRAKANGSIDQQIQNYNDRIDQMELRLEQKEERLRKQFSRMEQIVSNLQSQNSSLSSMSSYF